MSSVATVCALWGGGALSYFEQLSLASYLAAGHPVTLYALGETTGAPEGVAVIPAETAIGRDAARSEQFRYRLMRATPGAIWTTLDICCLKTLTPDDGYLLGHDGEQIMSAPIALPPDSPALVALAEHEEALSGAPWADGVEAAHRFALTRALVATGESRRALPPEALAPIPPAKAGAVLRRGPKIEAMIGAAALVAPLYGEESKRALIGEPGGLPKYWSLLGKLIRAYGINPKRAPLPGSPPPPDTGWDVGGERPSLPSLMEPARKAEPAGRVLIVTTMKNEGPFILEWIAYHRAIGVTDFLVYTNDCTDGTDDFHDLLARKGIIAEHLDNPFKTMNGVKPQHAALSDGQTRPVAQEANWVIGMDVDEFINIHVGDGTFQDLLNAVPDANMISMPWRLYGNGFVRDFRDDFITDQFTWCAPQFCRKPHQAWGFKTAFRQDGIYRKYGVHRPVGLKPKEEHRINWVSGSGRRMPKAYHRNGWRMSKLTWGYDLVTLNHYSLRSSESFMVKRDRGRVNHVDRDQGLAYWFRMNHNAERDRSIMNKLPAARAEFDRLMQDPEIAVMHNACVAAHRRRIDELLTQPAYQDLLAEIESERMKNLSRMLKHFGNAIFLEGPSAVPQEYLKMADEMGALEHA